MKDNRLLRERQYEERRKKDQEEELQKFNAASERTRQERTSTKLIMQEKFKKTIEDERNRKTQVHNTMCHEITHQLIDIAIAELDYKAKFEGVAASAKERKEWLAKFVSGINLIPEEEVDATHATFDESLQASLDESDFASYIAQAAEWKMESQQECFESQSAKVIEILQSLKNIITPVEPEPMPSFTSKYRINAVIVGSPFTGTAVICKRVAEKMNLAVINPYELARKFVAEAEAQNRQESPSGEREPTTTAPTINIDAQKNLLEGKPFEEHAIVSMLIAEIQNIEKNNNINGWIIEEFPKSLTCAKLLEKSMTGYEDKEIDNTVSELYSSKIIQKVIHKPKFKAFSHVVFLQITSDIAFSRAIEQEVDTISNTMYHKVVNPPPQNVCSCYKCSFISFNINANIIGANCSQFSAY